MKKFFVIFTIFIAIFFGAIYFTTTPYFFNKFLAPNIKKYNFNYKSANGSLLTGFEIEGLSYKGEELSSNVDFKFEPFNLLSGLISIDRLRLIGVNKDCLSRVIKDFKGSDKNSTSKSSSSKIDLNFEFKNIFITIKPFKFKNLIIEENRLEINYLSYIYGDFNLGDSRYYYKTNIGEIDFSGAFKDKNLYIKNINLKKLDFKELLAFVESSKNKNNKESRKNSKSLDNNLGFLPQNIYLETMKITLKPFNFKGIYAKDIKLNGTNIDFDLHNLVLKQANLNIRYKSNLANIDSKISFFNKDINVSNLNVEILKPKEIEKLISNNSKKVDKNGSKNKKKEDNDILSILPLENLNLNKLNFALNNYKYKELKIKKLSLFAKDLSFKVKKSKLKVDNLKLNSKTSFGDINLKLAINKQIKVDSLSLNIYSANKLKDFISSFNEKDNSKKSSSFKLELPEKTIVNKAKITFKDLSFLPYTIKNGEIKANKLVLVLSNKLNLLQGKLYLSADSNWGYTVLDGDIKDNNFYANGKCKINQTLLDRYKVPLKAKNLKDLEIYDARFGLKSLDLKTTLSGKNILKEIENFDILESKNIVKYDYKIKKTVWNIDALIKTPYTNRAKLVNNLSYADKKLNYDGTLKPLDKFKFVKNLSSVLDKLSIKYNGSRSGINLFFISNKLEGKLIAKGYKGGILEIKNRDNIKINKISNLGKGFNKYYISKLNIKAPINFKKLKPINGDLIVKSNLIDISGKFNYNKYFSTNLKLFNPKKIKELKNINTKALFPLKLKLVADKKLNVELKNNIFTSNIIYAINSKNINLKLKSKTIKLQSSGTVDNISLNLKSSDLFNSLKEINRVYKIKNIPKVKGSLNIKAKVRKFKDIKLIASSSKLEYKDAKQSTKIEDILIDLNFNNNRLVLNKYKFKTSGYKIFANKNSIIDIKNNKLIVKKFWINDLASLDGYYFTNTLKGKFNLNSNNFKLKNNDGSLSLKLKTKIDINKDRYYISGLVDILKARIKKNLTNKNVADNDDIIIIQKQRAKKSTKYAKNIKLNLKVISKGGIVYSQNGTYFKMYPKLKILKNFNSLTKVSGIIKLDKSSYYKFRDKKLKLKRGLITFKGKSSTPYLNIVMYYRGKDYTININISGTPARPALYFSSNPPLSKDQILAYLLFDDSTAAGTHSQQAMLNLIGGTLAKSFFGAIGIKIDHISIKENGFSIGKSINDKVTIYYNQEGDKPSIKTRIDVTNSVHTEIKVGEESQSADIIFSKEY